MATRADPVERILDGALSALARYGLNKLSMVDVSDEAGVSRGTLYRYFSTKGELVDALADYVQADFERSVRRDMEAVGEGDRVGALLSALVTYAQDHPALDQLVEVEPRFVRSFYRDRFPALVSFLAEQLEPGARSSDATSFVAELLLRVAVSHHLVGAADGALDVARLKAVVEASTTTSRSRERNATPRRSAR